MNFIALGMYMPSTCEECRISIEVGSYMHCPLFEGDKPRDFGRRADCGFESRPEWCPLRPLPDKHGRLIDADVLERDVFELWKKNEISNSDWIGFREILKEQPTIVEAEGEQTDMASKYGFGVAISLVKSGHKMKREGWNGKDQFIEFATNVSFKTPDGEIVNADHKDMGNKAIAFHGTSGVQLGWLASQADMLAEDWVEV